MCVANRTKEQISYNMSRVRSTDSALEKVFADELTHRGITTYSKNDKSVFGNPDFVFRARKVAVFVTASSGMDMIGRTLVMQ